MKPSKTFWMAITSALLISSGATLADQTDDIARDKQALQGTWTVAQAEDSGEGEPPEDRKEIQVIVEDETIEIRSQGASPEKVRYTLDPSKDPRQIDATIIEGQDAGKSVKGIYEVSGDTARFSWAAPGEPRPENFDVEAGSKNRLFVMKRGG